MPAKCCVPECRSNYSSILRDEPYTSVFRFPSESHRPGLRQKWIQFINRKGWVPTKRSVVCIKHFHKEDVISCDKFTDADGVEQTIPRRCPVLKPYACPTIPPPLPTWLATGPVVPHKKPPNIQAAGIKQENDSDVLRGLKSDLSSDSSDFTDKKADKCCVPGCRSNYRGQKPEPMFGFPSDPDLKEKWLELIGRRDYVVNSNSFVCAKHFQPDFLITVHHVDQGDGTILCFPRIIPNLQTRALPTICLHASSSSSAELPRVTTTFNDNKNNNITCDLEISQQKCFIKDSVASFHSLCNNNESYIHQWMNMPSLADSCTDKDTPGCDQMTRKCKLWTQHTSAHRPGFTEMCRSMDTATTDIEDVKPPILTQSQASLVLTDLISGDKSRSTPSGTTDLRQTLAPGHTTGVFFAALSSHTTARCTSS